jgi:hypothetical protein
VNSDGFQQCVQPVCGDDGEAACRLWCIDQLCTALLCAVWWVLSTCRRHLAEPGSLPHGIQRAAGG